VPPVERNSAYRELVARNTPPPVFARSPERQLDELLARYDRQRSDAVGTPAAEHTDRIDALRTLMREELVPAFHEVATKYTREDLTMEMDATNFLSGGRELTIQIVLGDWEMILNGMATTEGIAIQETRRAPHLSGDLNSGSLLRMNGLTPDTFRHFLVKRLARLLRTALRNH
jgi:hypothetical protein